jgi:chemotaxis protein histidine kinase CheA
VPQRAAAPKSTVNRAAAPARNRAAESRHERAPQREQSQNKTPAAQVKVQPAQPNAQPSAQTKQQQLQAQQPATARQQQREEQTLRRREDRALRQVPRSQRAAKREEIRRAREQRAQQRLQQTQQSDTAVHSNAAVQTTGTVSRDARAQRRALRRNRDAAVTPQVARRGRFAAPFAAHSQTAADRRARWGHYAARRAWSRGYRAAFVPWYGPVFWPYAYSDIFDYAFWPGGYEDGYWAYAYDDFIDSLFWGEQGPPDEYLVYGAPPPPRPSYRAVQALCKQPGSGITAWPFAEIERKVGLDAAQKRLLGDVRDAATQAAGVFKASCPSEDAFPLTPPGRLRAMTARLDATLQAVGTVRPALEAFYDSLSDEQKERFNEIGPKGQKSAEAAQALPQSAQACAEAKPGLTNLPIERIEVVVKPSDAQEDALDRLDDATVKAVSILQAACPEETPLTPPGRLEAMATRLQAMIDAANTVKPALDDFYGSLTSEQKARFNRIGKELASKS